VAFKTNHTKPKWLGKILCRSNMASSINVGHVIWAVPRGRSAGQINITKQMPCLLLDFLRSIKKVIKL